MCSVGRVRVLSWQGACAQLIEYFPSIYKALNLILSTTNTGHGGSQHSGGGNRRIKSSKKAILSYIVSSKLTNIHEILSQNKLSGLCRSLTENRESARERLS